MNTVMNEQPVFKICARQEWHDAFDCGFYKGSALDLADGYIHLSTRDQVAETAQLHFRACEDLLLVAVDAAGLDIRYEESRHGQMFPHLFSDLPVAAAISVKPIMLDEKGIPVITTDMLEVDNNHQD